jgi:hypothetical protein
MNTYSDSLKVKDALQQYFSKYHFANGGYDLKWFKIKMGFLYIPLPNTKARVAAVKIHDIHHLLTEYEADYRGEAEIAGWEIASGCKKYSAAWILNFGSFFYGMFFFPGYLFRAFMRGRRMKTNLYYKTIYNEALLNKTVGELRQLVEINSTRKNIRKDYLYFVFYCFITLAAATIFFFSVFKLFNC